VGTCAHAVRRWHERGFRSHDGRCVSNPGEKIIRDRNALQAACWMTALHVANWMRA